MVDFIVSAFLASQVYLGVVKTPPVESPTWTITEAWDKNSLRFKAETNLDKLNCDDEKSIYFPLVLYGAQTISVGSKTISFNGENQKKHVFNHPVINCKDFAEFSNSSVVWEINSYSAYFAMVTQWPEVREESFSDILAPTLYVGSTVALFFFALMMALTLSTKENVKYTASVCISAIFLTFYFIFSSSNKFGIDIGILLLNKIADTFVILSFIFLNYAFYLDSLISKKLFRLMLFFGIAASVIVTLGRNGDEVQLGTSLIFVIGIVCLFAVVFSSLKRYRIERSPQNLTTLFCSLVYLVGCLAEVAIFSGSLQATSIIPPSMLFAYSIFAISINGKIQVTYKERDQLFLKMEDMVELRTAELKTALREKDIAQAELVESAKLASLGTLSAGIAHEINNSINYINACLIGLEKQIGKIFDDSEAPAFKKMNKLISTMRHGTKMTINIVSSLRTYTGMNQAKMKKASLKEIIQSVETIIKTRTKNILIEKSFDSEVEVFCSIAGLSQVFMNLITNSVDAIGGKDGVIKICAEKLSNNHTKIIFEDNGGGIPEELIGRVFDPFFTTKDVGSGTGLGLHIVKKEIEGIHSGSLNIESFAGQGTKFTIILPDEHFLDQAA